MSNVRSSLSPIPAPVRETEPACSAALTLRRQTVMSLLPVKSGLKAGASNGGGTALPR